MADVTYTLRADVRRAAADAVPGKGDGPNLKAFSVGRSLTARTVGQTVRIARLPSNARLSGHCRLYWDQLANTGAPQFNVGIAPVGDAGNLITANPTALAAAIAVGTTAGDGRMIGSIANFGRQLWEILGLAQDPGGLLDVYLTVTNAATNVTGNIAGEISYTVD